MAPITENPLTWFYLPTALMLGALHALEPGHAKTLTAAYLIGIKGTKKDATLLGLSVALTHSIVVIGISVAALWLGREAFTEDVTHWLQIGSGIIVVILGAWLMVKRILAMRRAKRKTADHHHHHGAPDPVMVTTRSANGILEMINTDDGEKIRFTSESDVADLDVRILITRPTEIEVLEFRRESPRSFVSVQIPQEPHEFSAEAEFMRAGEREIFPFAMHEPHDHYEHDHSHHDEEHDHSLMDDDEHARAHAATIPEYAKHGERPTILQILAFGAAGGMIPCPASISVMLLALSIGKFGSGLLAVLGFSTGLALTLVGIGLIVVSGLKHVTGGGRFKWLSANAPIISAGVVMLSGFAALLFAH